MNDVESTVLRLFGQYTSLEDREASSLAPDVLRDAKARIGSEIATLLSDTNISELFLAKIEAAASFEADMDLVESTGALDDDELDNARKNAPRDARMGQVALRFLAGGSEQNDESDAPQAVAYELPALFKGNVQQVADNLVGKRIHHGSLSVLVAGTQAQTKEDNKRWLASRPLFGDNPVDVFVAGYRGNPMLFLRAEETDSCVRVSSAIDPVNGDKFLNPKQVCEALGLDKETVGHMTVRDNVVTLHIDGNHTKT